MTQAGKVAEIFTTAGEAFTKLGSLAMSLQPGAERPQDGVKWGDEEIDMLHSAVQKFGSDVEKISTKIKSKSAAQTKAALKQKMVNATPQTGSQIITTPIKVSLAPSAVGTTLMTLPRPQIKIQTTPRQIGQKSKAMPIQMTIRGATPMNTTQMVGKKIKLESSTMNVLTSLSPAPITTLIRQNTPVAIAPAGGNVGNVSTIGVPIMASGQGFQVIVPPQNIVQPQKTVVSAPTVLPVALLQSGIVQKVSNANTNGNVDVES